jgi:hypothetical protein
MVRKIVFVVVILFFVAAFVYAKSGNSENGIGDKISKWRSMRIDTASLPTTSVIKAQIHQIFFTGNGIAVNPDDKLDFKYIRIIAGRVLVPPSNISENSSNSPDLEVTCVNITAKERCFTLVRAGVLFLDKEKYTLRELDVDNDSATASIYKNDSEVGSIALVKVVKMGRNVWVGTLTISGTTYYAYILGLHHPLEIAEKVEEKADTWEELKNCGPKMPSVNATEISNCKKNGGRIYIGRDEKGCPMAPTCISGNCTPITPLSAQDRLACRRKGGTVVAGVDDEGCPVSPKCVLASGETG